MRHSPTSPNSPATECCDGCCRWSSSGPRHWHPRSPPPACTDGGSGGSGGAHCGGDGGPDGAASAAGAWPAGGSGTGQDSAEIGSDRSRCPHSSCCHRNRRLQMKIEKIGKLRVRKIELKGNRSYKIHVINNYKGSKGFSSIKKV